MDLVHSLHHQAFQILPFIADPFSECVCVGGGGGGGWGGGGGAVLGVHENKIMCT